MNKSKWLTLSIVVVVSVGTVLYLYQRSIAPIELPTEAELQPLSLRQRSQVKDLLADLRIGNPRMDGIPAVDRPQFDLVQEANVWLLPDDVVFGVMDGSQPYAYPQRILVWHEIVNTRHGGRAASVTYCPLTGTAIGFYDPNLDGERSFGVSGKLVNSNLVMYDRATLSYWPQLFGSAIKGPALGDRLAEFPVSWTTWERWRQLHPTTKVLSRTTGFIRDYGPDGDPYGSYLDRDGYYYSDRYLFPPTHLDPSRPPKDVVIGVRDQDNNAVAVSKKLLQQEGAVQAKLAGRNLTFTWNEQLATGQASYDDDPESLANAIEAMWFAWYAYYPDTQIIE